MKHLFFLFLFFCANHSFAQISIPDKTTKKQMKSIPYDGSFMDFNDPLLSIEKKAGVVGEKITLIKVWSVKKINGEPIISLDPKKFENRTFQITEYNYDFKDILKIRNESEEYIFEPSSIDEYVLNKYIDSIKSKLDNKIFIPLNIDSKITTIAGNEVQINGTKEYKITKVEFAKLSLGYGITVELNDEFELIFPNKFYEQPDEKDWINLSAPDLIQTKISLIEKSTFLKFATSNKTFLNEIRNGKVKIGMSEKQCRIAWGAPTSSLKNIAGYDLVLRYGDIGNSDNLYFKSGILRLIK